MFGFRFSLAQMAVMMVIVCLGCAAIVSANTVIASISLTVFFMTNLVAVTGSFTSTGQYRAFWIGMAVFGWGYWWQHEPTLLREDSMNRYRYSGYSYPYYPYIGGYSYGGSEGQAPAPRLSTEWLLEQVYKYSARSPKVGEKVIAPLWAETREIVLERLDKITMQDLCDRARELEIAHGVKDTPDFTI